MKLLWTISVEFDTTDQLLIGFSAFVRSWRKEWEYKETVQQLCKMLGFHGGGYEECSHLGGYAMWLL
jgi:hypothetical protein